MNKKPGRNELCPCGSGKKYKQCHMLQEGTANHAAKYTPSGKRKFKAKVIKLDTSTQPFFGAEMSQSASEPGALERLKFRKTEHDFRLSQQEAERKEAVEGGAVEDEKPQEREGGSLPLETIFRPTEKDFQVEKNDKEKGL